MSDLKNLAWTVQEQVEPLPFEQLERRGVRRRRRRRGLVVAAAAGVIVVVAVVPWSNRPNAEPPIAPSIAPSVPPLANASDPNGEALVRGANANVSSVTIATPTRWGATWSDCNSWCTYAAVLNRDGVKATTPVWTSHWSTLQVGNEVIALGGPAGDRPSSEDPAASKTVMFRLTERGPKSSQLRYLPESSTFRSGEILTGAVVADRLFALDVAESTVRPIVVPGADRIWGLAQDSTGRWWVLGGQSGDAARSDIFWTDDRGKTWDQALIDPDHPGGGLALSPDGRTVVATSQVVDREELGTMRLSTDRGATWTTVDTPPWVRAAGPVAFDGGIVMMNGMTPDDPVYKLRRIADGKVEPVPGPGGQLNDLRTSGSMLYGPLERQVMTSPDHGKTWTSFEPR